MENVIVYVNVAVNKLPPDSEKVPEKVREIMEIDDNACEGANQQQNEKIVEQENKAKEIPDKIKNKKKEVQKKIKELKNGRNGGGNAGNTGKPGSSEIVAILSFKKCHIFQPLSYGNHN